MYEIRSGYDRNLQVLDMVKRECFFHRQIRDSDGGGGGGRSEIFNAEIQDLYKS